MENNMYSPMMSKEAVKFITQNITPEQVQYVADIKNVQKDCEECGCDACECDSIIYITKIMAFADKFRTMHWAAPNMSYHKSLDEFCDEIESYKDAVAENIQSVIGQFTGKEFTHLDLPVGDNPLEIINELKICVNNYMECIQECGMEYEGIRNATSTFLEAVHKYIYLFRFCKE